MLFFLVNTKSFYIVKIFGKYKFYFEYLLTFHSQIMHNTTQGYRLNNE